MVLSTEQARSLLRPDLKTPGDFPFKVTSPVQGVMTSLQECVLPTVHS